MKMLFVCLSVLLAMFVPGAKVVRAGDVHLPVVVQNIGEPPAAEAAAVGPEVRGGPLKNSPPPCPEWWAPTQAPEDWKRSLDQGIPALVQDGESWDVLVLDVPAEVEWIVLGDPDPKNDKEWIRVYGADGEIQIPEIGPEWDDRWGNPIVGATRIEVRHESLAVTGCLRKEATPTPTKTPTPPTETPTPPTETPTPQWALYCPVCLRTGPQTTPTPTPNPVYAVGFKGDPVCYSEVQTAFTRTWRAWPDMYYCSFGKGTQVLLKTEGLVIEARVKDLADYGGGEIVTAVYVNGEKVESPAFRLDQSEYWIEGHKESCLQGGETHTCWSFQGELSPGMTGILMDLFLQTLAAKASGVAAVPQ